MLASRSASQGMIEIVILIVLALAAGVPLTLAGLASVLRRWMTAANAEYVSAALGRLAKHARTAALDTHREYVRAILAGREDGKLTAEERRQAMALAMARLWSHANLHAFARILGIGEDQAARLGQGAIELAIVEAKDRGEIPTRKTRRVMPPCSAADNRGRSRQTV